jgi:hypothetical protein
MLLKDGDKKSDIFSLGRVINFIMKDDPTNYNHFLRSATEKGTNENPQNRFQNIDSFKKMIVRLNDIHQNGLNEHKIFEKIETDLLDEDVINYIYQLDSERLCKLIINKNHFVKILIKYVLISERNFNDILNMVEQKYEDISKNFSDYDNFELFSYELLKKSIPFIFKERCANILSYIAWTKNRFSAQNKIKEIWNNCEPLLQDILRE